jgi:hypothetical protein
MSTDGIERLKDISNGCHACSADQLTAVSTTEA